ncbi:unnamed protein product [Dicrocoelium dendriticum]|nr:unnamed protein product [Dicrocoelium dendriticum]
MLRLALLQMRVDSDKFTNLAHAGDLIATAASQHAARLVCLPECFNCPYGTKNFDSHAELVPEGPTCQAMSELSKKHNIWLVAGSIPERGRDGKLYNCSATFNPAGNLVGTYRKLHLFDLDVAGQFAFKESSILSGGKEIFDFELPLDGATGGMQVLRVGVGICYDVRFPELALIYAHQRGCQILLYPGAFNTKLGPIHWELLAKARALDAQCYVGMCSPACDPESGYISHAESLITSPWGVVVSKAGKEEEIICADLDLNELKHVRESIPVGRPIHWELLAKARALDAQCYVGMCSPACDPESGYISHAESLITSPWGVVVSKAGKEEEIICADLDLNELKHVRESIPVGRQRRLDVYTPPKLLVRHTQK